ncbi:hypothetical protein KL942_000060 [Ogataea angusta]|uniref:Uncharacterized protein n=1 Tax=Pichia angusta TaxID=870730 RepID=A0AAN6I7B4_PICAN|nr:uncharacterized protein KL928_000855 [Ogataea angusta]KAG7820771.1 hypothetical protein KL928_000855 [Ogataea angusta]KAG7835898.1 hypothetical protein KL943_001547 [Ogataea angusta]KAG7842964.1 hypothetical protein KL942_000060 [Ogataea angusta]KAG7851181.1 hypothetical protein KL941_000850 [Ogataea angusta]KAG7852884.1 hypothetical protein KL940_000585 [Ogataea angusta]
MSGIFSQLASGLRNLWSPQCKAVKNPFRGKFGGGPDCLKIRPTFSGNGRDDRPYEPKWSSNSKYMTQALVLVARLYTTKVIKLPVICATGSQDRHQPRPRSQLLLRTKAKLRWYCRFPMIHHTVHLATKTQRLTVIST